MKEEEKLQAIVAELKRLKEESQEAFDCYADGQKTSGAIMICDHMLSFVEKFPPEPKFEVGDVIRKIYAGAYDTKMIVVRIKKDYYLCDNIGKYSSCMVGIADQDNYELVKEPESMSQKEKEALDKAAIKYAQDDAPDYKNVWGIHWQQVFKAGAQWRKEYDRLEVAKAQAKIWENGFKDGKQWLMKDAMEGRVINNDGDYQLIVPALPVVTRELDEDDKVKVIVITDDE